MKKNLFFYFMSIALYCNSQTNIDWNNIDLSIDSNAHVSSVFKEKINLPPNSEQEYINVPKRIDSLTKTLSPQESVIFNLYYPIQNSQNCTSFLHSDSTKKYIYSELTILDIEMNYSPNQRDWIQKNRKIIYSKMNIYLLENQLTQKMIFLILKNNLYECFPAIINSFKRQSAKTDYIVVSLLYSMIDENEFPKKTLTVTYNHFKTKEYYDKKQLANPYIVKEILKLAEEYYIFKMQKE